MRRDVSERPQRWMALDPGEKKIGVAISDPLHITSRPLTTIQRESLRKDCSKIVGLIRAHDVNRLIVGRPLHLDGRPGSVSDSLVPLVENIRRDATGIEIVWAEERLSSKEAESLMAKLGVAIEERRKKRDEIAAALILRWYLEEVAGD